MMLAGAGSSAAVCCRGRAGTGLGDSGGVMRILSAVALAVLTLVGVARAADDAMLKKLVGDWVGTGQFRWDSVSDPERL